MATTRGSVSRRRQFSWTYNPQSKSLVAINDRHRSLSFEVDKVVEILAHLKDQFGDDFFPLANHVVLLSRGEEKPGFAATILQSYPGDLTRAQGASYLGVMLEELGYFEWNKKSLGIAWRLVSGEINRSTLIDRLSRQLPKQKRGEKRPQAEGLFITFTSNREE